MIRVEEYPEVGLTIRRGAIDPDVLFEARQEAATLHHPSLRFATRNIYSQQPIGSQGRVDQRAYNEACLKDANFRAIRQILKVVPHLGGVTLAVNYQMPHSRQLFHLDQVAPPVSTVQLSSGGYFDYVLGDRQDLDRFNQPNFNDFVAIPVDFGDMITQTKDWLIHRGRNPTGGARYNVGFYPVQQDSELSLQGQALISDFNGQVASLEQPN